MKTTKYTFPAAFSFWLIIICWLIVGSAAAQNETDSAQLRTPYQTLYTHLYFLQPESYRPDLSAQAFDAPTLNVEEKANLATELIQIYDGLGYYIDIDEVPRTPNYIDSVSGKAVYRPVEKLPRIYLERQADGKWRYAAKSVKYIDELHKEVYPFGLDKLLNILPKGSNEYLGLAIWQHISLAILLILGFVWHKILTYFFRNLLVRAVVRIERTEKVRKIIKTIARPLSFFVLFTVLLAILPVLQLPVAGSRYLILGLKIAIPVFLMSVFYYFVDLITLYFTKFAEKTESTLDDQLIPLVRKALKLFVIVVGVLFILQALDFNITALLTGISIGGLAFALAAQDTIKNLFGSVMIFIDRPFQIGDWIVTDDIDGTVEEVGFRSTRIRTFHNSVISIPNGNLANMTVDNMGLRKYRRYSTKLTVTYDTPPEQMEAFVEGLRQIVAHHPLTRKDYYQIHLNEFGSTSLNILFYVFFEVADWGEELAARHNLNMLIIKLADALSVRFAFPTQTLHIEDFPGRQGLTPDHSSVKGNEWKQKTTLFIEKNMHLPE